MTEEGAYSNLTLAGELQRSRLPARDRQLAADLAYGTVRKLLVLDRLIAPASTRPLSGVDPAALALLRLGAYQLLFTRIPDHAAVSETVGLAAPRHRAFVNAILRKVAVTGRRNPRGTATKRSPPEPAWRRGRWGSCGASCPARRRRSRRPPWPPRPLSRSGSIGAEPPPARSGARLSKAGFDVTPGAHHPDVLSVPTAVPALLPGYREGWFAVQDESSVLVAAALRSGPVSGCSMPVPPPGARPPTWPVLPDPRGG